MEMIVNSKDGTCGKEALALPLSIKGPAAPACSLHCFFFELVGIEHSKQA